MNSIQTIRINDTAIQIYGNLENPLFDCQSILIKILGYTKSGECRFYKDNKKNDKYIRGADRLPSETAINQAQKKYFTEIGLHRCLFTSQKPIAIEFQEQVASLLKDIRIGNLKLLVQKECDTTKLLQQNKETLLSYITKNSELEQQILKLQAIVDSASDEIHIYEIEINGKFYVGSALELIRRLKQHMKKSSNPAMRRACSQGAQIKTRLLHSQKVTNRHERNYVERAFIKQTPQDLTMNINIPRVRDSSKVSEECKQELNQALNMINQNGDNLTIIDEQTVNNTKVLKQAFVDKWKAKYEQYFKFTELLHRNPADANKDRNEKLLAKWVYKQRLGYDKLENWQQEQLSKIKYFKPEIKIINTESFEVKLSKVVNIYKEKGSLVQAHLGSLFSWYCDQSKKIKANDIGEYEKKIFIQSGIPLYVTSEEQWMIYYNYCLTYYQQHDKLPVDKSVKDQFNYGKWIRRQLGVDCIDKLSTQQIQLLADVGLTEKKNKDHLTYMKEFKQYMEEHKAFPKTDPNQTKDGYLYKWLHRNLHKSEVAELVKLYSEQYKIVITKQ